MNAIVGEQAPDVELLDHTGAPWSLRAHRGQPVVLYFYPKDGTAGCTRQACDLRDRWADFAAAAALVVGVSVDDVATHASFREEHDLPQTLLVDQGAAVTRAYGAWGAKLKDGVAVEGVIRSTVVVSADGRVAAVLSPVTLEEHAQRALDAVLRG